MSEDSSGCVISAECPCRLCAIERAVAQERERCARIARDHVNRCTHWHSALDMALSIEAKIREGQS